MRWVWPGRARAEVRPRASIDRVEAARRLRVRTRRRVTDVFAGHYVSALRGAGIEYAESRPYVPGDDVRDLDWNATARTGVPHVKQHRPERGRTITAFVDTTATMRFGTTGATKLAAAVDAVALLSAAAIGVGDRVGLVLHDERGVHAIEPRRGELQLHRLLDALVTEAERERTPRALGALIEQRRRRGEVLFRFGDARGEAGAERRPVASLAAPAPARTRGEGILVLCSDPGELCWPEAGSARLRPQRGVGRSLVFDGDDALARGRFERAARRRVARIARDARARGDDFVHFRTDHDPLRLWLAFFRSRASRWRTVG